MHLTQRELVMPFWPSFQASRGIMILVQEMLRFQPDMRPTSDQVLARVGFERSLIQPHTMPDKFENATLLLRIRLPSTLIRIKTSTKTELFENAFQSGTI